ncbi:MAG: glycosyltransferase family 4 protein [Candidatus Gracilibacteria bacterium]
MKRILIICGDLNPNDLGGAEVHIVEVIKRLAERGYKLEVFVGIDDSIKTVLSHENISIHTVQYKRVKNFYSIFYARAALRQIRAFLRKNKVDILHSKQTFPQGYIAAKLKREFGLPLYQTIQNPLAYKEELVIKGSVMKIMGSLWLKFAERWVKFAMRNTDLCGCVSSYSEEKAIMLGAKKTMIIPNGVDTDIFYPMKERAGGYKIVTTSTLIPRNGIDVLVRAFGHIAHTIPQATLEIAGDGPMEDELKHLVKELGVEGRVKFLGTLPHEKVPDLLRSADLFVRPSRAEGFGVSFVEAMACGVPVITCPSGGIVDFVVDGKTGIFVRPDDPKGLADAIEAVFIDIGKLEDMKVQALKMVRERYSWDKITDKVCEAYNRLIV